MGAISGTENIMTKALTELERLRRPALRMAHTQTNAAYLYLMRDVQRGPSYRATNTHANAVYVSMTRGAS